MSRRLRKNLAITMVFNTTYLNFLDLTMHCNSSYDIAFFPLLILLLAKKVKGWQSRFNRYKHSTLSVALPSRSVSNLSSNNHSEYLAYYLAGLIEGDGHLNTPAAVITPSGSTRVAAIEIVFALKDRPSADLLQSIFGGRVYLRKDVQIVRWLIQDIKCVTSIVKTVNGKFRTPKIQSLHTMIDYLNAKGLDIIKLPVDCSEINSNAWLAGFIDADGHFAIKGFTSSPKTYLAFHFQLSQRKTDKSGEDLTKLMLRLADFLQVKLSNRIFSGKFAQLLVNTSNPVSNLILINYLANYPLLSSKHLDFKDWETAYNMYVKKLHKDPVNFAIIKALKANMNSKRSHFNWDHHKGIVS